MLDCEFVVAEDEVARTKAPSPRHGVCAIQHRTNYSVLSFGRRCFPTSIERRLDV